MPIPFLIVSEKIRVKIKELIEQGRLTETRVGELKKLSTSKLEEELEVGMQVMMDYYCNGFYLQKYENDPSFLEIGSQISDENAVISQILEERNKAKLETNEITEIPIIARVKEDKNEAVIATATNVDSV